MYFTSEKLQEAALNIWTADQLLTAVQKKHLIPT